MEGVGADDPEAVDMRDNIAHKMWVDYLRYLEDEESNNEDFEDVLRFNSVRVEIRELRPEVLAESDEVLVHHRSRTNV